MTDLASPPPPMSLTKEEQYKAALRQARSTILELQNKVRQRREPVAVIGMACLFPGGDRDAETPAAFFQSLLEGKDSVLPIPPERQRLWEASFARRVAPAPPPPLQGLKQAALLRRDLFLFDCQRFGLPPAEARMTDPQHRLLLELSWKALEHAGIAPERLAGSDTGVFAGKSSTDFLFDVLGMGPETANDPYTLTGNMHSSLSGRIAHFFDWHGPSLSVETACSTALVAILQAVRSVQNDECSLALAGAVNLLAGPTPSHWLQAMHSLAADGRCKAFGQGADGFGRGEGGGVLLLKRLADAQRDGNRIVALILGGAVGSDGRSGSFTAPNAGGQRKVMRRALDDAGVDPAAVGFVETHGTGTPLGDPIEVESLSRVYGQSATGAARPEKLRIGSVKSNIGHLEAAAGMAGIIKAIEAVNRGLLPPSLHAAPLNPLLDWSSLPVAVTEEKQAWPPGYERRIAGVSSFGFSGTLAHLLIAEPPETPSPTRTSLPLGQRLLLLSAADTAGLRTLVEDIVAGLETGVDFAELCDAAANGRQQERERLALVAANGPQATAELRAFLRGTRRRPLVCGQKGKDVETMFMYSGQGSQRPGMGRVLYQAFAEFRDALDRCEAVAAPRLGHSLVQVLFQEPDSDPRLDQARVTQAAIYAHQVALTLLLRAHGCRPAAVMGHSIGEYAAAFAAGVFSLETGMALVLIRGEMAADLCPQGRMAAALGSETRVRALINDIPGLCLAAVNSAESVTLAGAEAAILQAMAALRHAGLECLALPISRAFHSPLIEPMLKPFGEALARLQWAPPALPFLSCQSGRYLDETVDWPSYFVDQTRAPVCFHQATLAIRQPIVLEIGATPTLTGHARQGRDDLSWLCSQNRGPALEHYLQALAGFFVRGTEIDGKWLAADRWRPEALPLSRSHLRPIPPPGREDRAGPLAAAPPDPTEAPAARQQGSPPADITAPLAEPLAAPLAAALELGLQQCETLKQIFRLQQENLCNQ